MPPPLHSPWSRWVSWIFKDIPTLLSIWAPSVQLLMFKQTDTRAWRLQRLYTALWTKVWPALFTKGNRGAGQLYKCAPCTILKRSYASIHKHSACSQVKTLWCFRRKSYWKHPFPLKIKWKFIWKWIFYLIYPSSIQKVSTHKAFQL